MARQLEMDAARVANKILAASWRAKIGKAGAYVLTNEVHQPRILLGRDTRLPAMLSCGAYMAGI